MTHFTFTIALLIFAVEASAFALTRTIPRGKSGEMVQREGYALQYNALCKISHWVSYAMTEKDLVKNAKRTNDFRPDPEIKVPQAQLSDYKRSGYDRGHLGRAGIFTRSKKVMSESFILSNIVPQNSFMNQRGAWREVEDFEYLNIQKQKEVLIVTGPVVGPNMQRIGANEVCVPNYLYKVIYRAGNKPSAIAFIIPNYETSESYEKYAVTIDQLEKETGLDFLHELPDAVENKIEATLSESDWYFP